MKWGWCFICFIDEANRPNCWRTGVRVKLGFEFTFTWTDSKRVQIRIHYIYYLFGFFWFVLWGWVLFLFCLFAFCFLRNSKSDEKTIQGFSEPESRHQLIVEISNLAWWVLVLKKRLICVFINVSKAIYAYFFSLIALSYKFESTSGLNLWNNEIRFRHKLICGFSCLFLWGIIRLFMSIWMTIVCFSICFQIPCVPQIKLFCTFMSFRIQNWPLYISHPITGYILTDWSGNGNNTIWWK